MAARQAIGESTAAYYARGGQTWAQKRQGGTSNQASSGVSAATRRQVSSLFAAAKKIYEPGGGYMAGTEAAISRGSKRAVASGIQNLASVGLAGTSMIGGLGKKYEEEVGMPTRMTANTARLSALSGLLQAEAGATASLATRYSTSPAVSYGGGGGGGTPGFRTTSAQRPATQKTEAQPTPKLNFPGVKRYSGRSSSNSVQPIYNPYTYSGINESKPSTVSGGSLMRQADKYDLSRMYF